LYAASALLLLATVLIFRHFAGPGYFALSGRPWHWPEKHQAAAAPASLPQFQTTQAIASETLTPGGMQTITISATASSSTPAKLQVWITSPKNKQIWRSPEGEPVSFPAGRPVSNAFSATLPATAPRGTYRVAFLLTSADELTDYAVKPDFAEFTVQ
jgi:hypothetical protein